LAQAHDQACRQAGFSRSYRASLPKENKLRVALSNTAAGIEPIERQAARGDDGVWRVRGLSIPVSGRWTVELEVLVSDFEMLRLSETLEIRP
jgi:copper transport protein